MIETQKDWQIQKELLIEWLTDRTSDIIIDLKTEVMVEELNDWKSVW
jgi:hypothetical protein